MFTRRFLTAAALIAATALTGCGRSTLTAAPTNTANSQATNAYQADATIAQADPEPTLLPTPAASPSVEPLAEETPAPEATPTPTPEATPTPAPVEAELVKVEKKGLLLPKLVATVRVTNTSDAKLNTVVKIDFYGTPGILNFTKLQLVETKLQPIANLAAGQSIEFQVTSTKSAKDAEVSIAE